MAVLEISWEPPTFIFVGVYTRRPGRRVEALQATAKLRGFCLSSDFLAICPDLEANYLTSVSIPRFIPPCQPSYSTEVPVGPAWVYEIKHDGYRFILCKSGDDVRAFTRNGKDWTEHIPLIVEAVRRLPAASAIIDGECVVCNDEGLADFDALRSALGRGKAPHAFLYAFDLLELDGDDLRKLPWEERRARLVKLLKGAKLGIVLSEHIDGDGTKLFEHACAMGLEGLVAKRRRSIYRSGSSRDWIKVKNPASPAYTRVKDAFRREA